MKIYSLKLPDHYWEQLKERQRRLVAETGEPAPIARLIREALRRYLFKPASSRSDLPGEAQE